MRQKCKNMHDNQKEKILLDIKLKGMEKYIRMSCWGKSYQQTSIKQPIDLNDPHFAKKWDSKYIDDDKMYDDCIIKYVNGYYPNIELDEEFVEKVINAMKKSGGAGPDTQNSLQNQQLFNYQNKNYRKNLIKYILRFLNGKLSTYELKNLMTSSGLPIHKKDPKDLRPLNINNVLVRICNNCGILKAIQDVAANQLQSQFGINKNNALNLIIQSFDKFMEYMIHENNKNFCDTKKKCENEFDENKYGIDVDVNLLKQILMDQEFTFGDDEYINDEIIELLSMKNCDLKVLVTMKDDMENYFNRIDRAASAENIRKRVPGLYHAFMANYSYPTKIIVNGEIKFQKNGLGQGNAITGVCVIINEFDIQQITDKMLQRAKLKNDLLIEMNYYDDSNKGGTIKHVILNHLIKKKIGKKYNNKYNAKKTELILSHSFDDFNVEMKQYLKAKKFTINQNGNYEILGIKRGYNAFNQQMIKKINDAKNKIDIVLKLDNDLDKFKLLRMVSKIENFNFFIQNLDKYPVFDEEKNEIVIDDQNIWIKHMNQLHHYIMDQVLSLPVSDEIKDVFSIGSGFGGLAMRSINNILAPVYVSGIHKIVKPLMNPLDTQILYRTINKLKGNVQNTVQHYNSQVKCEI